MNPFSISQYQGSLYFCDRSTETAALIEAINANRSVTLYAIRRIGKTGLIHHVFDRLQRADSNFEGIYIDILDTTDENDFINKLIGASLRVFKQHNDSFLNNILQALSRLKPKISLDTLTGSPTIELDIQSPEDLKIGMDTLFSYIKENSKRVVIAIDEFQQIEHYQDSRISATLRSFMQETRNLSFIFSGSKKHMLLDMFASPKKALYRTTQLMDLDKIEQQEYLSFIKHHFNQGLIKISDALIEDLLSWTKSHTYYTQYFCNRLYSYIPKEKVVNIDDLNSIKWQLLQENENVYYTYKNLSSSKQWKLLVAIALEEQISSITANTFIQKYLLGAHSTVRQSAEYLVENELVYTTIDSETNKLVYHPYDPILMRWIQYKNGK